MIFLASDHAGFYLKERIKLRLDKAKIVYEDLGTFSSDAVDYPAYAKLISRMVLRHNGRGVMFCGSGEGMAIAANRFKGIRAAVCRTVEEAIGAMFR